MTQKLPLPQLNGDILDYDVAQSGLLNEMADYVIEIGSNSNGNWEKWHSGKMEIWSKLISPSFGTLTKEGEMYKSPPLSFDFPISFITPPSVFIQFSPVEGVGGAMTTAGFPKRRTPATNSNTGEIELLQNIQVYNNRTTSADIHAIGRWK